MSYETDLREELEGLNAALAELPDGGAATALVRKQLERRHVDISSELESVILRELELSFADESRPTTHSIETGVLGALLTRFQTTLNYMRWALEAGPAVEGRVPGTIVRSASTEAVALVPGSFKVVLRKTDLEMQGPFEESIKTLFTVSQALRADGADEEAEARVAEIGPEATKRLQKFYKRLATEHLVTTMRWRADDSPEVTITPAEAELLSVWLAENEPTVKVEDVTGVLKMADSDDRKFAIETASGRRIEGKSDVDLAHREIEAQYRATIVTTTYRSRRTQGERERILLTSLVSPAIERGASQDAG